MIFLTNGSEKVWIWSDSDQVWGNAGYNVGTPENMASGASEWWGCSASQIADQATYYGYDTADSGDATMTFCLKGAEIRKSSGKTGKFSFTMKDEAHKIGTFNTTGCGILFPCKNGTGDNVSSLEIVRLTETNFDLIYAADGTDDWGECTYWHFKAK